MRTREHYQDQFTEWIAEVCFIETGLLPIDRGRHLNPYKSGNLNLCRNHELMDERVKAVDNAIKKCCGIT